MAIDHIVNLPPLGLLCYIDSRISYLAFFYEVTTGQRFIVGSVDLYISELDPN